jgi:predicted house-cleaning noncanonical NTP pyrophosphatase (MazG superfamily)
MTVYNKLVRDRIPDIIRQQGEIPYTKTLEPDEYRCLLEAKLDEEVGEYHRDKNLEELADILEVVYALADAIGSREELQKTYQHKLATRGGFKERLFLVSKESGIKSVEE